MNVYISVPMSGRTVKEVEEDIKAAKKSFAFNKKTKFESNLFEFKNDVDKFTALGLAIERIGSCDAILVCPGWRKSKGCRIEVATALMYNIPIYGLAEGEGPELELAIRKKYQRKSKEPKKAVKKAKKVATKSK